MTLYDDIDLRAKQTEMPSVSVDSLRRTVKCFSDYLGRDATREDLTDEAIGGWLDSLPLSTNTIRHRRDSIGGLRAWVAANPDPNASSSDRSVFLLDRWKWSEGRGLEKRRLGVRQQRLTPTITADFATVVRKAMEVEDINPDVFAMLMTKWKRESVRTGSIERRLKWFVHQNRVAAELGWGELHDFSGIHVSRTRHWTENRYNMPTPEPLPKSKDESEKRSMTLQEFLDDHYVPARLVGKSKRTIKMYGMCINAFGKWLGRQPVIEDLTTETVSRFLQWLMENTELSLATIEKDRVQLSAMWRYAARKNILPEYPDIMPIRVPDRVPDAWSDNDMKTLMESCEKTEGNIGEIPASIFWPALVSVIYDTAERISAVMQIRHSDIDSDGWLTVRGEYRKGKTRDKRYKLRPETLERIASIRAVSNGKVFPWPYYPNYIWPKFGGVLEAAGLPNNGRTKFHKLRRTTASNFSAAGGDAQALLDHSSRRTTMRYLDPKRLKEVMPADLLPGIGEEKPAETTDTPDESERLLNDFKKFLQQNRGA
ncbi:tyrosine-type recombinase/integrase [Roseiconus lacunae]|uniref:tyrosine-type recombinase/integrase n=1 Tax=Roseiconus lacunae TaxID=2605694 RepID=UPI00308CF645|nr:tyrosine-type recombinase/integrase [Stieleria sp. HD01]